MSIEAALLVRVLLLFSSLAFLWILLAWLWRDMEVDATRQDLFRLRDELFQLGERAAVPFDSEAYGRLRVDINNTIRFADRCDPLWLAFTAMSMRKAAHDRKSRRSNWSRAVAELPESTRKELENISSRLDKRLFEHILCIAPHQTVVLAIVCIPVALLATAQVAWLTHVQFRQALRLEQSDVRLRVATRVFTHAADLDPLAA